MQGQYRQLGRHRRNLEQQRKKELGQQQLLEQQHKKQLGRQRWQGQRRQGQLPLRQDGQRWQQRRMGSKQELWRR